jgi:hypothetical protein
VNLDVNRKVVDAKFTTVDIKSGIFGQPSAEFLGEACAGEHATEPRKKMPSLRVARGARQGGSNESCDSR